MNLDAIASAGGYRQAVVHQYQPNVTRFLAALNGIRAGVLACEYKDPGAPKRGGSTLGKGQTSP